MKPHDDSIVLGRRAFLRSAALFGAGAGATSLMAACWNDEPVTGGAKFLRVDSTLASTGATASLDAMFDVTVEPGAFASDVRFCGRAVLPSGRSFPLCVTLAKDYANALRLHPLSGDLYRIEADGDPQPLGAPFEVRLTERTIPETNVIVITGQVFDPRQMVRVNFIVTHDPAPIVVVGIVAGIVALICGAVVLTESLINDCVKQAEAQCGKGRVGKITVHRTYGFGWHKGAADVGCGVHCEIDCHQQGAGG